MEVWALRHTDGGLVHFIPPIDDDGTEVFLAWPSKEQAARGLEHQHKNYDIDPAKVEIVRLG